MSQWMDIWLFMGSLHLTDDPFAVYMVAKILVHVHEYIWRKLFEEINTEVN